MKPSVAPLTFRDGFPDYVNYSELAKIEREFIDWYALNADDYDSTLPITFEILGCNEDFEREKLYNSLDIKPYSKVLELGAGSGRDSQNIASKLSSDGVLIMQDISSDILKFCRKKFEVSKSKSEIKCDYDFFLSNVTNIPYADNSFDRIFHFGGLNTFGNIEVALKEVSRVASDGAVVVIGDEGIAPWLTNSRFGRVLIATNSQYANLPPLGELPETSCNVNVQWFCSEAFYFISYEVRKNPRSNVNFDVEIPGIRGGTPRKRADGILEGVSSNLKDSMYRRALEEKVSRVDLIEKVFLKYLGNYK